MPRLILLRHGQSLWNQEGKFTGWMDIDLTEKGKDEARRAGRLLLSSGFIFDLAFTSVLKRAIRSLWLVQEEMDLMWTPVVTSWRLNERFYGDLQGRSKKEMEERYGALQIHRWRRGYRDRPYPLMKDDPRFPQNDPRYRQLPEGQIPQTESLEDTLFRIIPFWQNEIYNELLKGKTVIIVSHGNTLRALVKHLEGISDEGIEKLEIPTGIPLIYELDDQMHPIEFSYL